MAAIAAAVVCVVVAENSGERGAPASCSGGEGPTVDPASNIIDVDFISLVMVVTAPVVAAAADGADGVAAGGGASSNRSELDLVAVAPALGCGEADVVVASASSNIRELDLTVSPFPNAARRTADMTVDAMADVNETELEAA
jgi:hypothetical protein